MRTRLASLLMFILAAAGQCDTCGGWFEGWNGGTCSACQKTGR